MSTPVLLFNAESSMVQRRGLSLRSRGMRNVSPSLLSLQYNRTTTKRCLVKNFVVSRTKTSGGWDDHSPRHRHRACCGASSNFFDDDDDIHMDYGMKCERWLGENGGRPIDHLLFYIIFAGHRLGRHQPPHTHTMTPPITELRADHSWIDPFIHRKTIERVWWFPAAARNN
jgi:hypothetical protein